MTSCNWPIPAGWSQTETGQKLPLTNSVIRPYGAARKVKELCILTTRLLSQGQAGGYPIKMLIHLPLMAEVQSVRNWYG
jgi:hypothetical protein